MRPLVGLIPAAGHATRLGLPNGSKEVVPVPRDNNRSEPVITALLDAMAAAGIERTFVVLRKDKWDIPRALVSLARSGWPDLAYLVTPRTPSIPATIDVANKFVLDADVVLGFADVVFEPRAALADLVSTRRRYDHDVVLALFPSDRPDKTDMVETDGQFVTGFRIKPGPCELVYTWILATWGPRFTRFLREFLERDAGRERPGELQMSDVLREALASRFTIGAHLVGNGRFIDVGTPEDLDRASREITD